MGSESLYLVEDVPVSQSRAGLPTLTTTQSTVSGWTGGARIVSRVDPWLSRLMQFARHAADRYYHSGPVPSGGEISDDRKRDRAGIADPRVR
jgi:hypothetical protein